MPAHPNRKVKHKTRVKLPTVSVAADGRVNQAAGSSISGTGSLAVPRFTAAGTGTVAAGAVVTPFTLWRSGAQVGGPYQRISQALAVAVSGDTIRVASGSYVCNNFSDAGSIFCGGNTSSSWINIATLTIEAEDLGNKPYFDMSAAATANILAGGTPHIICMGTTCTNLTIRGIRLKGTRNGNSTNAGIRSVSGYQIAGHPLKSYDAIPYTLTVEYCELIEHTNGMLITENWNGVVNFNFNVVTDCTAGDQSHGIYVGQVATLNARGNLFRATANAYPQANAGHLLKTRARDANIFACMFDPRIGGSARCIDYSNGGHLNVRGCIMWKPDTPLFATSNQFISFGPEQQASTNSINFAADGRTHSIFLAQNTIKDSQDPTMEIMRIYAVVEDQINNAPATISPITVRNNVLASVSSSALDFVSLYPDNSLLTMSQISETDGHLLIDPPVGSAADAAYQWEAAFNPPSARSDNLRGAYGLPTWRVGMAIGEWRQITGSAPKLAEKPAWIQPGIYRVSGPRDSIGAWCGACVDTARSIIYHIAGGGHDGYNGNQTYAIDLSDNAPAYYEVTPVSGPSFVVNDSRVYLDGRPTSGHTYHACQFIQARGRAMRFGSAAVAGSGGANFPNIVSIDPYVVSPDYEADHTYADCPTSITADSIVFKDTNEDVYVWGGSSPNINNFLRWNQSTATWSQIWQWNGATTSVTRGKFLVGMDTRRRRAFFLSLQPFYPAPAQPCLVGLPITPFASNGNVNDRSTIITCGLTGPAAATLLATQGQGWSAQFIPHPTDSTLDVFLLRTNVLGGLVYRVSAVLDASNNLYCDEFPTTGGGGITMPSVYLDAGCYTKFIYVPNLGGCYYVPAYENDAWFLRTN